MKFKSLLAICLIGSLSFISCEDDDDDDNSSSSSQTSVVKKQIETNVQDGEWRITKFIDSGVNETNNFTGYDFTFNSSGVLNANNGTNDYNGTWSVTFDSDDDSPDDLDFNINFNLTNDFQDLNDDWDIISNSATEIRLIDISGGNGGIDSLTFQKRTL
jgi:hypothetical protein